MYSPQRTGIANLPLHGGKAPRWLFERMSRLAREITIAIVDEYGVPELLKRLSDPCWFQALGCVLGYDWHSSGVTTVVCGAIKDGTRGIQSDLGFFVAGGKGGTSRKTPSEIEAVAVNLKADFSRLVYASRMAAKVDNNAVQDGYQLYHHVFFFSSKGEWAVVQQGMNETNLYARRYHWLSDSVTDFVCEPHSGICTESKAEVLNLVAQESGPVRDILPKILMEDGPDKILVELNKIKTLSLPKRHQIEPSDIHPDRLAKIFVHAYEQQPQNFESLLGLEGVGGRTIRALSLISELVYNVPPSLRDPALYSFAHGGKDGIPFPVDKKTYDKSIQLLHTAVEKARIGDKEKIDAIKRLGKWM
jgi:uncharacterized protein